MPQSVLQARQSEIVDMEQRISTLNQTAQTDLQKTDRAGSTDCRENQKSNY